MAPTKFFSRKRFILLCTLNALLVPFYLGIFLFCLIVTFLPIFMSRVGIKNLIQRLQVGKIKAHYMLAIVYCNYFIYLLEASLFWLCNCLVLINEHEVSKFFTDIFAKYNNGKPQGMVLLGAHFGNIEVLGSFTSQILSQNFQHPYVVLAQPPASKILRKLVDIYRKSRHINTLATNRSDLFTTMQFAINSNMSIGFLLDQKPKKHGVFAEFLGEYAAFPHRGIEPVLKAEYPVIHITAQRLLPGCFKILVSEGNNEHCRKILPFTPTAGNSVFAISNIYPEANTKASTASIAIISGFSGWLEHLIKQYPLQWFWDYNKWSRKVPK